MQEFKKVIKEFLPKVGSVAIKQILCFNMSYLTNSYIVFTLKMESQPKVFT